MYEYVTKSEVREYRGFNKFNYGPVKDKEAEHIDFLNSLSEEEFEKRLKILAKFRNK